MSGHTKARWRIVAYTYGCSTCGAAPGQPCVTGWGTPRTDGDVHSARSRLASANGWHASDESEDGPLITCGHCLDDPPAGHTCPQCGRRASDLDDAD